MKRLLLLITILLIDTACLGQTVKRGRNEGTFNLPASNVNGNGNLILYSSLAGNLTDRQFAVPVYIGGCIGIAEILQVNGQMTFINFSRLGPIEAHLQITTPKNNRLRFFGFALIGDLYLSTSVDTMGSSTEEGKPQYNSYPLVSMTADLDWIARPKKVPLKTYLFASLCDNPAFLFKYTQVALKTGIELKLNRHSLFVDGGMSLYKEKQKGISDQRKPLEYYAWIGPGGRYRFLKRFSILGSIRLMVFQNLAGSNSFDPDKVSVAVKIEAPLIFRETNTEAIRTLVFMEKEKNKKNEQQLAQENEMESKYLKSPENNLAPPESNAETFDYKKEKDALIKQREEIEKKMDDIEKLLKEE